MRFKRQRSGVIGTNQHSYFLPLKFLKYRSQYQFVYQLDGFNFIFRFKTMSAFVGSFNMNVNKVASALKRVYRRFCFSAEIGVYISRGALHVNYLHSRKLSYTLKKVYGGNHCAFKPIFFLKGSQLLAHPLAPEPDAVGGAKPFFLSLFVHRVILKENIGFFHHVQQFFSVFIYPQIIRNFPSGYIVGRCQRANVKSTLVPDQTVAVAYAAVKGKLLVS